MAGKANRVIKMSSLFLLLFHEFGESGLLVVLEFVAVWVMEWIRIEKVGFCVGERRRLLA